MRRISLWATFLEGVKKDEYDGGSADSAGSPGLSVNNERQVSAGVRCGCAS